MQSEDRTAEADAEHQLFLAAALNRFADGRANIGEYAQAAPVYEEAVHLSPRDFTLHLEYAEAALDAEDPAKAKVLAQEALALLPPGSETLRKAPPPTALSLKPTAGTASWRKPSAKTACPALPNPNARLRPTAPQAKKTPLPGTSLARAFPVSVSTGSGQSLAEPSALFPL